MSLMLGKRLWGTRCEKNVGIDLEAWTLDEASVGLIWNRLGICSAARAAGKLR